MKAPALKCSCDQCVALAHSHGFEVNNWFFPLDAEMSVAMFPADGDFHEGIKRRMFQALGIPAHFVVHEQLDVLRAGEGASRNYKFADLDNAFQAGELFLRRRGNYWFGRMQWHRKWYVGVEEDVHFVEWDVDAEQRMPSEPEWALLLAAEVAGVPLVPTRAVSDRASRGILGRLRAGWRRG